MILHTPQKKRPKSSSILEKGKSLKYEKLGSLNSITDYYTDAQRDA